MGPGQGSAGSESARSSGLKVSRKFSEPQAAVQRLLSIVRSNVEAEEQGLPISELTLNRVFLGNPGTGELVGCTRSFIEYYVTFVYRRAHAQPRLPQESWHGRGTV